MFAKFAKTTAKNDKHVLNGSPQFKPVIFWLQVRRSTTEQTAWLRPKKYLGLLQNI